MNDRRQILQALYAAVKRTNEALPEDRRLETNEAAVILGDGATIDSLGFVSLIVAVEEEVEAITGSSPSLAEEVSDPTSGVSTLGELADFILSRS